jgi:serine/threonine-protein kinase
MSDPPIGTLGAQTLIAGRYRLVRLLGSGGMAQVWEAVDETLGRGVAVKVLHPHLAADATFVRRFRQEAIAAARLTHPGIVGVYDTCSDGVHESIVLELLDARTLRDVLDERGTLDVESTRRIGLRMLDALEAAHRCGLVHRDVKPSNVLLCTDGRVKIADFGIAKADDQTELTREGSLVGTAAYLSPEQLTGDPLDGRSDLYSLGVVLYECLAGRVPFKGDSGAAIALARLHHTPLDPRQYRTDIPASLAATVMRALSRDPHSRFADAAEFRAALEWVHDDPAERPLPDIVMEREIEPVERAGDVPVHAFGRAERRWLFPALLILLVGTALVVAGLLFRRTTEPEVAPPSTLPPAPVAAALVSASAFDPEGRGEPGENNELTSLVIDGDAATSWRTETYQSSAFSGTKDGVGLVLALEATSTLDQLTVDSSANGWSGEVHLIQQGGPTDPDAAPAAVLDDVRGQATVDLGGARADLVLLWITDLGDDTGDGRFRVDIGEVAPRGTRVGGA